DHPHLRAALGTALLRAGRPAEAVDHIRRATDDNPFDNAAAAALVAALAAAGQADAAEAVRER
ncbi:unnamed protein product, partial [Phaeothamnion confervicola]